MFVVNFYQLHGVPSQIGVLGHHHRYRLTHVTHFIPGQHRVLWSFDMVKFPFIHADSRRDVLQHPGNVIGSEQSRNARRTASGCGVNGLDASVGVRATQHRHVKHARQVDVVNEDTLSGY
jgi:hypothetical protein